MRPQHAAARVRRATAAPLLVLAALLPTLPAFAQRFPFELYGPGRDLTSLTIECILQDADKVLWIGTRDGLFRYTGERFTPYLEPQGLPSQRINSLLVFHSRLWIGTAKGVAIWNGDGFDKPLDSSPLAGVAIYSMIAAGDQVWLGTAKGLWMIDTPTGQPISATSAHVDGPVFALYNSADGTVWAAADEHLMKIDAAGGPPQDQSQNLPGQRWRGLQGTADGSLWIRSADQVWRRRPNASRFELAASLVRTENNFGLFRTPEGGLAVPTLNGLRVWNHEAWDLLDELDGLPASWTACAYWDHEGNLWVGLPARGVARQRGHGQWLSWTTQDGLPHSSVNAVARDAQGLMWVASPDGVARLPAKDHPGSILHQKDGLPPDNAIAMVADARGSVWVGYAYSGIVRLRGALPPQTLGAAEGLPSRIFALKLDSKGQLWASTRSGLYVAPVAEEHPRFTKVAIVPDSASRTVYQAVFTSDGALWAACSDGLFRRESGSAAWQHFTTSDGLLELGIPFASPGVHGDLWIGYGQRSGVARVAFKDGKLALESFSTRNNTLLSDDINFVEADPRGWLWVGTHRGVDLYDDINDGAAWRHFDFRSGLVGADTVLNAFLADPDGSVWIGTNAGLSQFHPPAQFPPVREPDAWLLSTAFGTRPVTRNGVLQIPWSGRAFAASFAPATFELESSAVSRFRLIGKTQEWTETTDRLHAFSDIGAGDYVLEVQASADRAHWSPATRFAFRVLPAWWQRWWVQLAGALGFLLILRLGWMLRMKRHVRHNAQLEQMVAARALQIAEQQRRLEIEKSSTQKAIRAASESDRRFRSLLEEVRLATLICDAQGRISFCNDFLLALTGWSSAEVLGLDWIETFIPAEERDSVRAHFHGGSVYMECSLAARDGRKRFFQWNNTELRDESGAINGVASIGADVTEQRRLAEQNLQTQKMESLGRMAGGLAHDFNNLLTVINGYGDLVLRKLTADAPARRHITEIRKAGGLAAELAQKMLTFSRKQAILPTVLNLNDIVTDSSAILQRLVGEAVHLETKLHADLGWVKADSGQIGQILMNLAANARDAMPHGGRLTIETGNVNVAAAAGAGMAADSRNSSGTSYVQLLVTDTGVGMDEETQKHIFEPFFTLKKGSGTGLGLATVYGIVEQSGGLIRIDSAPEAGTTFRVLLPRVAGEERGAALAAPGQEAKAWNGTERVLVVEDNPEVRTFVVEVLHSLGYRVFSAASGADALRQAEHLNVPLDLLLTDIVMPGMSGRELADHFLRLQPDLKVLYMSGFPNDILAPRGILDDKVEHIAKPFRPETLASRVREALSRGA